MITANSFSIDDTEASEIVTFEPYEAANGTVPEMIAGQRSRATVVVRNLEDPDTGATVFLIGDGNDEEDTGVPLRPGETFTLTMTGPGALFAYCDVSETAEVAVLVVAS